jgi:hypothetical protein
MAAVKKGRMTRTKECEKYMLDWRRSSRMQMSGRGLEALEDMGDALDAFIAVGPLRKVGGSM